MTLVLHFSQFNRKLMAGYLMRDGKKVGDTMSYKAVLEYLRDNPDTPCDCLYV